jgi:hypothetical protein
LEFKEVKLSDLSAKLIINLPAFGWYGKHRLSETGELYLDNMLLYDEAILSVKDR